MSCKICINEGNIKTMYNDCIIECLEKIKFHYMSLKGKLNENEILANGLRKENDKLRITVREYEELERNDSKKRRTASCEEDNDSEISFSQNIVTKTPAPKCLEKTIAQKSAEDLNQALNFEEEFEFSFIPNTQIEVEEKRKGPKTSRQPLKALPVKNPETENKQLNNIKQEANKNKEKDDHSSCRNVSPKKTSSWISKENEFKKMTLASVQKKSNRSLRHFKKELKPKSMSLKPGKLRQTRLQLDVSKNMSTNFSDTTFCDEAIDSSPNADFSLKRINSSKQWQLRNISSKITSPDEDDSILDFTNPIPNKSTSQSPKNKSLETSSVVMCTPASQEIIFLDDSCESFNIESMDLLKDLINPTESLSNLRRIESERIKMLQKNNGYAHKHQNSDEKLNNKATNIKSEHEFVKPKVIEKNEAKKPLILATDKSAGKENHSYDTNKKTRGSPVKLKAEKVENVKKTRIFDIDCDECQAYIKYLGAHLTDEEIQQHIRNCTNHKKRIDANLTPDGFWDPIIQPFASDDPRNATLIDDRFIVKKS